MMDAVLIELLVGLFFVGYALPGIVTQPISRGAIAQFLFGVVLVVLALLQGINLYK